MAVQALFSSGVLTVHSEASNAAPDVPEYVDDGVGGSRSILEFSVENHPNNSSQSPDEGPDESIIFVFEKIGSVDAAGEYQEYNITKVSDHGVPEIIDEGLVLPQEEGANDSIWIDIGAPITGTGYGNPSPFQINSVGMDDMGRNFDLVFPTQTAFTQRESNAVATESLEIAHEGFVSGRDDGWCIGPEVHIPESVHTLYDLVM